MLIIYNKINYQDKNVDSIVTLFCHFNWVFYNRTLSFKRKLESIQKKIIIKPISFDPGKQQIPLVKPVIPIFSPKINLTKKSSKTRIHLGTKCFKLLHEQWGQDMKFKKVEESQKKSKSKKNNNKK